MGSKNSDGASKADASSAGADASSADAGDSDASSDGGTTHCGNGKLEADEACDDGNQSEDDDCLNDCTAARCGDGHIFHGVESCDDGNLDDSDGCLSDCTVARCGDGFVQIHVETCDDKNTLDTDDCTNNCQIARCGDEIVHTGVETCDDGNMDNEDGCTTGCHAPFCGDGYVTSGEDCDDGNMNSDDACDASCVRSDRIVTAAGATCILRADGTTRCWGFNAFGQVGVGSMADVGTMSSQLGANLAPISIGTNRKIVDLAGGDLSFCALLDDASVKCWGDNRYGQLGVGDINDRGNLPNQMGDNLVAVDLGTGRKAKHIAAGGGEVCAILDNDALKCWGSNGGGQLGLGDTNDRGDGPNELGDFLPAIDLGTGLHARQLAIGYSHICALLDDNSLKCWGNNSMGQLGLSDMDGRGDDEQEMGDALPRVKVGTGRIVKRVFAGGDNTCALLDNAELKCWGANSGMALVGTMSSIGAVPGQMNDSLVSASLGTGRTIKSLAMSNNIACAVLDNDAVKCWGGYNPFGGLGYGDADPRGDMETTIGDSLPAVDIGTGLVARHVAVGWYHACALLTDGRMKCWGLNDDGELALGDKVGRGDGANEMGDALPFCMIP